MGTKNYLRDAWLICSTQLAIGGGLIMYLIGIHWALLLATFASLMVVAVRIILVGHNQHLRKNGSLLAKPTDSCSLDESVDFHQIEYSLLSSCALSAETKPLSKKAVSQLQGLKLRTAAFQKTLDAKLNPQELTHLRYCSIVRELSDAVIGNLSQLCRHLEALCSYDSVSTRDQLNQLSKQQSLNAAEAVEHSAYQTRLMVAEDLREKANRILSQNELALTKLDQLQSALCSLKLIEGRAPPSLTQALDEIEQMTARVNCYSSLP